MDAQGTMRLMFDTMDAYDRADFDRLAEIYAEDAQWLNANPNGPHCHNREDIFAMFRQRMASGIRVGFDELRSTLIVSMWGPGAPGLPDPHSDGRARIRGAGRSPSFLTRTSD
jgi:hypothetical protein